MAGIHVESIQYGEVKKMWVDAISKFEFKGGFRPPKGVFPHVFHFFYKKKPVNWTRQIFKQKVLEIKLYTRLQQYCIKSENIFIISWKSGVHVHNNTCAYIGIGIAIGLSDLGSH